MDNHNAPVAPIASAVSTPAIALAVTIGQDVPLGIHAVSGLSSITASRY